MQKEKLAIIVPYRDRKEHLKIFIAHFASHLKDINYDILVIEQNNYYPFNRGLLLNAGFLEAQALGYDYFAFHDVDQLPIDADYSFAENVTIPFNQLQQHGWTVSYPEHMGGAVIFDRKSFIAVDGFPNKFWGWGAEDDELSLRVRRSGIPVTRRVGKMGCLQHYRYKDQELLSHNKERLGVSRVSGTDGEPKLADGLSTIKYRKAKEKRITDRCKKIYINFDLDDNVPVSPLRYHYNNMMLKYKYKYFWIKKLFLPKSKLTE